MKSLKKIIGLAVAAALTLSIVGCGAKAEVKQEEKVSAQQTEKKETAKTEQKGTKYPVTITDSTNKSVIIDKEPMRVISVGPNITEAIYAVGMGSKLVGRTDYCDFPEEAKKVQSIGTLQTPNIEKITELKPDLVIVSTHFKPEIGKKLEDLGIKVIALYGAQNFEGVYKVIGDLGIALNANEKATQVTDEMKKKVADVQAKVKGKTTPSVYYVVSYSKDPYTAGKDTFIGSMIELAGAKNAADDVTGWKYSLEKLIEKNPDIMVCSKYLDTKKGIQAANGYKELKAVKENKLFEIDNNMLDRQGPRLADGLLELAKIVHPEAYK